MSTREETRAYYDRNAEIYDAKTGFDLDSGQMYNLRRYFQAFLDDNVPTSGRILELGCGTGFYTRWLAQRGLDVVAMDISANMLAQARQRCPEGARFVEGDCQDPAAALGPEGLAEGFDVILGINTFSYYPAKRSALSNYREILRDGGRLMMLDMNGTSFTQRLAYLANHREARRFRENVDESTPANLRKMLREAGYEVESMRRFTFMPNAMGPLGVKLWGPVDVLLSHVPLADYFAIRIGWIARKV